MENPTLDVLACFAVALQEAVDKFLDLRANHFRNVFRQQDVKTGIAQIETNGPQRIRECVGLRDQYARPWSILSGYGHRRGSVAKQDGRNQIGLRNVLALKSERREFDRNNQ